MRYLFLLFTLLFAVSPKYYSQWSTDPNNNLIIGYGLNPELCSDSAGGCYITYEYGTTGYPRKLAVERLNRYGYKPWVDKIQILGELEQQWHAEIIEDGEGGVIIGYEDNEWIPPYYFKSRVRVQKVDSSGNFLWGSLGGRVSVLEDTSQGGQHIVSDGEGGCVVLWQDYAGLYWINRITKKGERAWSDSGVFIGTSVFDDDINIKNASDGNYYVQTGEYIYRIRQNGEIVRRDSVTLGYIVPDPEGGIILSGRVWTGMIPKLVAQQKDSLGNNLWQEPYVEIADSLDINTILNIKYNNGYIYYSWTGKKNGVDKVAQFQALRLDGTKLFSDGCIQIGIPPLGGAYIIPLEKNKTSFIYHETNYLPDSLLVQNYDTLGNKLWNKEGVLISHPSIEYQSFTTDRNGGLIIGGVINHFTVVVQQVSSNGNLGEIISAVDQEFEPILPSKNNLYQNYPNPFNSTTIIKYQIPTEGRIRINLYNILGEKILTLLEEEREKGIYSFAFSSNELPSGNYFYSLECNSFRVVKKLTILK